MSPLPEPQIQLSPLKRAVLELREMRARIEHLERAGREPIAIIGMGLNLPGGARDGASLWRLLADGVDAVSEIPADRWDLAAYYDPHPEQPGKMYSRHGAFISGVDQFDAEFFGISPREAESMDPQHRLLLETSWAALEDAALDPTRLTDSQTGVFVGYGNSDYWRLVYGDEARIDAYSALGNAYSAAAGRLSYFFGCHGPCLTVDTACSSSLVALHLACQSLRAGECGLALVGGVNLILTPEVNINFCQSHMLAPDGRCKTFDARADGYVRGEGCGVVVLKPLSAALADHSRILAVISGSAVNQDGRSGGLTAPSGPAQEAVIQEALKSAGIAPADVSYLEAHGTGTSLGDPIEVRAAAAVLCQGRTADRPLAMGALKTNIGHLEAAAGIASLMKVVLALRHRQIPPHLHLKQKNPYIEWDRLPIMIPHALTAWEPVNGKRIAGVSSFGFCGTNAHVILEEAPEEREPAIGVERPMHLLALSARDNGALKQLALELERHLASSPQMALADACFTANAGRAHWPCRVSVRCESIKQAHNGLRAFVEDAPLQNTVTSKVANPKPPLVAFLFTGPGSQYVDMGRNLYESSPVFKQALDRCDEILRPLIKASLVLALYPKQGEAFSPSKTAWAQPQMFAVQYALAELWRSWGVEPAYVLGYGVSEYVAACVAGIFDLETGLKLALGDSGRDALEAATGIQIAKGHAGFISSLTGELAESSLTGSVDYWRRQSSEPVQFAAGMCTLNQLDVRVFVELGASPVSLETTQRGLENGERLWVPSLKRGRSDWEQMLESVQLLYSAGVNIDWAGMDRGYTRSWLTLPGYPFQRRRYWIERERNADRPVRRDLNKSWQTAASAGLRQSRNAPLGVDVRTYAEKWRCLERLTTAHAAHTLRALGAFARADESHTADTLIQQFGVPAMYRHLLERWMVRLTVAGQLLADGKTFVSLAPLATTDLTDCLKDAERALADDFPLLAYLRNCSQKLTQIMAGKESPLETLFPGGDFSLAEQLYENANSNQYMNAIAAAAVEAAARSGTVKRPFRILEVGAGTGGTSATVLPLFDPATTTYLFSDVSDVFLTRARERFAAFPFVRFGVFDLEKSLEAQGYARNSFDAIICANVVHAVRDLAGALGRLSGLLAPGGILVLAEATQHHAWFDMTTGLIEGWQHFDDEWRGDNPLLTPERWHDVLQAHGFCEVVSFPENGSPAGILGQHVILARTAPAADGAETPWVANAIGSATGADTAARAAVSQPNIEELRSRIARALPDEKLELMNEYVGSRVMEVLRLAPDRRPDQRHRLMDLGLDSLMAVQLRNLLEAGLGLERVLPATLMFDYPTIEEISAFLLKRLSLGLVGPEPPVTGNGAPVNPGSRAQEIQTLSEDEAEALLIKRLDRRS